VSGGGAVVVVVVAVRGGGPTRLHQADRADRGGVGRGAPAGVRAGV
jgi:hypothetical protein